MNIDELELNCENEIVIDSLTDCIYDRRTNERYETEYSLINISSHDALKLQQEGWSFDWNLPINNGYDIYKLTIKNNDIIQGSIAIKHFPKDYYTHISLVESSPLNRGNSALYKGVGGNLFAIACKLSFEA